jgi:serine/threonine protein kinase
MSESDAKGSEGKSPNRSDRDLIREAIEQGTPVIGAVTFKDDLPPEGTFPGYELLRELHRGGQGVVYQAIQKATRRKVAIKVLHPGPFSGSAGRTRFEREVQVLGQLNHPNIVRLHDSGVTADGRCYYVMDYIPGRSLEEVIADRRLSIDEAIRIFLRVCDAIGAAHLKGVIHRDIKPSNIRIDANGEPIVVDFGLAKVAGSEVVPGDDGSGVPQLMTLTGQFVGSLPWASPEQAEGVPGNIDVRTDVYSLGVVFFQLLTGEFPYAVIGNMRDVLDNILRAEPTRPSTIRRQVNDEIETIVLKCLAKERDRRYQSAGELARDIRRYLAGEPIEAKRDSTAYVISKTLRRYRGAVVAGCAFLVLLAGFSIAMSVLYRDARRSEKEAQDALAREQEAVQSESLARERADRNFRAGHRLAMTLVNDIERRIAALRGATPAREALLREAQTYLDSLETEIGDDPALLLDLAQALEKLGNLRGELYMRRTGQSELAEANFARARAIREGLVKRLPGEGRMHAALARSLYRSAGLLAGDRRFEEARAEYQEALASYDRALTLGAPDGTELDRWRVQRAWCARAMGDALINLAMQMGETGDVGAARTLVQDAERRFEEALAVFRDFRTHPELGEECSRGVGVIEDAHARNALIAGRWMAKSARTLADQGRTEEAVAQYRAAIERFGEARRRSDHAAEIFRAVGEQLPASLEARRSRLISLSASATAAGDESGARRALASLTGSDEGAEAAREGALETLREVVRIARRLGDEDTANLEARRDLAVFLGRLGAELRATRRFEEAESVLIEVLDVRRELFATDPMVRHEIDIGAALYRLGQLYLDWSRADEQGRADRLEKARRFAGEAAAHFHDLSQRGVLDKEHSYVREAMRLAEEAGVVVEEGRSEGKDR